MKNKKFIGILGVSLMVCMLLAQFGCASKEIGKVKIEPMEPEESYAVSYDIIGGKDVMPVGGYYGPYSAAYSPDAQPLPNFRTDEYMKAIADAGVNMIIHTSGDTSGSSGKKLLDLAAKYGVGVYVHDTSILKMRTQESISVAAINEKLSAYRNHSAFCGIYMVDEPGGLTYKYNVSGRVDDNMEDYIELTRIIKEEFDVDFYSNLIRIEAKSQEEAYEGYLKEYCESMHPTYMSFDLYLWEDGNTKSIYLFNTAMAREYAQKYKIPFWSYIQCGKDFEQKVDDDFVPGPHEGQFDWSINVSLAMGAQGIEYFTLFQPHYFSEVGEDGGYRFDVSGMIGAKGNKNQWYYFAQDISKQISAVDAVLMNSVNKGVLASGKEARSDISDARGVMMEGTSWRELADIEGNTLVGCFNYQGKTALYVVNYDHEYAQDIKLKFHDKYNMQVTQDGETDYLNTSSLTLKMKAGDGALIVLQ